MFTLQHNFLNQFKHDASVLLETDTLASFIKSLVKLGKSQDPDYYDPLKYMGDGWELFVEFYLKFFNGDHTSTYLYDYEPNLGEDKGVDGFAKSTLDGQLAVVQCKFKADPTSWLTNEDNTSNVSADAYNNHGLVRNGKNVVIMTTSQGVHPKHAMYSDNVNVLNRKDIARRVDKNVCFWDIFRSVIFTS